MDIQEALERDNNWIHKKLLELQQYLKRFKLQFEEILQCQDCSKLLPSLTIEDDERSDLKVKGRGDPLEPIRMILQAISLLSQRLNTGKSEPQQSMIEDLDAYFPQVIKLAKRVASEQEQSIEAKPSNLFYDRLKLLFYSQKQFMNYYYLILHSPDYRKLQNVQRSISLTDSVKETEDDGKEEEEDGLDKISVFSYDIFTYHVINSFLLATRDYLSLQHDIPSTVLLLPPSVRTWFAFFDESIIKKFLFFLLFAHRSSSSTLLLSSSDPKMIKNDDLQSSKIILGIEDRQLLCEQISLLIIEPSLLLQLANLTCQLISQQYRKQTNQSLDLTIAHLFLRAMIVRYLVVIRTNPIHANDESAQLKEDRFLFSLFERIFLKFEFSKDLIMQLFPSPGPDSSSSSSSSRGLTVFTKRQALILLCKLIDSWGNPYFHNNSRLSLYESYSSLILTILINNSIQMNDLNIPILPMTTNHNSLQPVNSTSPSTDRLSVQTLLIDAISKGLESSFPIIRYHTMKIAKQYAKIMNYELEFDELKEYEEKLQGASSPFSRLTTSGAKRKTEEEEIKEAVPEEEDEEEEDEEDEIEGYFISKEHDSIVNDVFVPPITMINDTSATSSSSSSFINAKKRIYYLKQCLDLLKAPEGSPDIRAGIILTLENLPSILQHRPFDGGNYADKLLFQLLNLTNQYNIENFDSLKSTAIVQLVKEYPLQTLPMLNQSILNPDVAVGLRIQSIQYHRTIAALFYQANLPIPTSSPSEKQQKSADTASISGGVKTIIKRPRRYQLLKERLEKQRQTSLMMKKNIFQQYSDFFISPLLQLLQQFYQHYQNDSTSSSSKEQPPVPSFLSHSMNPVKEKFNLITETFPSIESNDKIETVGELSTLRLPSSDGTPAKKKNTSSPSKPLIEEMNNEVDLKLVVEQKKTPSIPLKKVTKSNHNALSSQQKKMIDETDILLPYDALLSLAMYMKYSTLQLQYRVVAMVCIELSIAYYKTFLSSLPLRRAVLCLLLTVVEGLVTTYDPSSSSPSSSSNANHQNRVKITGILDSLLKITTLQQYAEEVQLKNDYDSKSYGSSQEMKSELLVQTSLLPFIEILLNRMEEQHETDPICQQLTYSLIQFFQEQLL